ncbi:DUF2970 domain-containing protein [Pseudorhodoferax sp. Leaf267]|uniref:DUF2970 domain-containing protein n=1 Tax=Pseudorhodoferax sp. Leaf267 TaxID=1736316 RepID=UPI0006F4C087|nr:DUF2970 domain-containing protein [Pseudorhodoferax sp. Leaf267]KQP20529.1 hypothetical protein ASF43_27255 [Pseudorhodoferax sp. Leaf267]
MAAPQPSFWRTLVAVAWSFFGVRKRSGWDEDMARITPMHLVVAGLLAVVVLVLALIALVNWVVA